MNGRLVRKTLSFSKELRLLQAATALEDALYNFTRPVKTLRVEVAHPTKQARWQQRTPAMAAGLTDHRWTGRRALDDHLGSIAYEHLRGRPPNNSQAALDELERCYKQATDALDKNVHKIYFPDDDALKKEETDEY